MVNPKENFIFTIYTVTDLDGIQWRHNKKWHRRGSNTKPSSDDILTKESHVSSV